MRIVVQRSGKSNVFVNGNIVGEVNSGLVLLVLCIEKNDTFENIQKAAKKILAIRVFEDENRKMNKSIIDIGGEILAISPVHLKLAWIKKEIDLVLIYRCPQKKQMIYLINLLTSFETTFVKTGSFW